VEFVSVEVEDAHCSLLPAEHQRELLSVEPRKQTQSHALRKPIADKFFLFALQVHPEVPFVRVAAAQKHVILNFNYRSNALTFEEVEVVVLGVVVVVGESE